jgi:hypothetical protein
MATVEVSERWSERSYGEELSGTKVVFTATQVFDVINSATEADALAKLPVTIGAGHDVYGDALTCTARLPEKKGFGYWIVRCQFRSDVGGGGDLTRIPPEYRWGMTLVSEEVDRDAQGNPIVNSVGDPPLNHPQTEFKVLTLYWEQYENVWDPTRALKYIGAVNSDDFTVQGIGSTAVFKAGECKCADYRPTGGRRAGDTTPLKMAYEFQFRARIDLNGKGEGGKFFSVFDWRFRDVGNRGYGYDSANAGADSGRQAFYSRGEEVIEPVALDGHGKPLDTTIRVGKAAFSPVAKPKPKGSIVDNRFNPDATFLLYQRCLAWPFKGLIANFT